MEAKINRTSNCTHHHLEASSKCQSLSIISASQSMPINHGNHVNLAMAGWEGASPDSSLSSVPSDDLEEPIPIHMQSRAEKLAAESAHTTPPRKKRKVNGSVDQLSQADLYSALNLDPDYDISSDTSGDLPNSPRGPNYDEEDSQKLQQTFCRWDGCPAAEMHNMDNLVRHIHEVHIGSGKKHYSCEWDDCARKGVTHPSAYALRAHMRSHTREKPFYCMLPECDKAFTRSDALAKHMRTVHETEAQRIADAAARLAETLARYPPPPTLLAAISQSGGPGAAATAAAVNGTPSLKIKLVLNGKGGARMVQQQQEALTNGDASSTAGQSAVQTDDTEYDTDAADRELDADEMLDEMLSPEEAAMGRDQLLRVLEREMVWALEEKDGLAVREAELAAVRLREWREKEVLLDDLMELGKYKKPVSATPTDLSSWGSS